MIKNHLKKLLSLQNLEDNHLCLLKDLIKENSIQKLNQFY